MYLAQLVHKAKQFSILNTILTSEYETINIETFVMYTYLIANKRYRPTDVCSR